MDGVSADELPCFRLPNRGNLVKQTIGCALLPVVCCCIVCHRLHANDMYTRLPHVLCCVMLCCRSLCIPDCSRNSCYSISGSHGASGCQLRDIHIAIESMKIDEKVGTNIKLSIHLRVVKNAQYNLFCKFLQLPYNYERLYPGLSCEEKPSAAPGR